MAWKKKGTKDKVELKVKEPTQESVEEVEQIEAIVNELPQLPTRKIEGEAGKVYRLTTQNEALLQILETVRDISTDIKELLNRTEE